MAGATEKSEYIRRGIESDNSWAGDVAPATFILPLLNGFSHMQVLDRRFGAEHILGGIAQVAAMLEADGTVRQLAPMHSLTVGGRTAETQAIAARFVDPLDPALVLVAP